MATKEFLRKLRQKHHLGEYSTKGKRKLTFAKVARMRITRKRKARYFRKQLRRVSMARRKRHSFGRRSGGIMAGLYKPTGFIAAALLGAGAATIGEKILPPIIPYQNAALGFVVGGIPGAAGALAKDLLKTGIIGGGGTSAYGSNY